MRKNKSSWILKLFTLVALILTPSLLNSNPAKAWSGMNMSKLHVNGNQLVNSSGQPVLLSGWHQPSGSYWTYQSSSYYLNQYGGNRHAAVLAYLKDITDTFTTTSSKYGSSHGWYMNQIRLFIDREDMGDVAAAPTISRDYSPSLRTLLFRSLTTPRLREFMSRLDSTSPFLIIRRLRRLIWINLIKSGVICPPNRPSRVLTM